jgi:hypothetical protein
LDRVGLNTRGGPDESQERTHGWDARPALWLRDTDRGTGLRTRETRHSLGVDDQPPSRSDWLATGSSSDLHQSVHLSPAQSQHLGRPAHRHLARGHLAHRHQPIPVPLTHLKHLPTPPEAPENRLPPRVRHFCFNPSVTFLVQRYTAVTESLWTSRPTQKIGARWNEDMGLVSCRLRLGSRMWRWCCLHSRR